MLWEQQLDNFADAIAGASALSPGLFGNTERDGPWFPEYVGREEDFVREVLGLVTPKGKTALWAAQRHMLEALWKHRRVVVRACRKSGKTFAAGVATLTALYTAPTRVILLSPTLEHLRDMVWAEIAKAWRSAKTPLAGELLTRTLRIDEKHAILGIPCKDPNRVRGYHAGIVMPDEPDVAIDWKAELEPAVAEAADQGMRLVIVIDEPEAIDPEVFRVLRGSMSGPNIFVLMIGNPTLGMDDEHEYVRACRAGSGWHRIKISAFPESEYEDPLDADASFDTLPPYFVPREARVEAQRLFDRADPSFLSDWLGQFSPGSTSRQIITRAMLEGALAIHRRPAIGPRIGVDIGARQDPTILALFHNGEKVAEYEHRCDSDDAEALMTVAGLIAGFSVRWGEDLHEMFPDEWDGRPIPGERISVDDSGMVGVADRLAQQGIHVDRVNFGAAPSGHWLGIVGQQRSKNARAEMYWAFRRGLQEGIVKIPMRFVRSWDQLQWAHFDREIGKDGPLILLEPKEDIIARHGRSPDHADADVLAMRETRVPTGRVRGGPPALVPARRRRRRRY